MRLIDADKLNRRDINFANVPMNFIDVASTVEAYTKDEVVAMLEGIQAKIKNKPCNNNADGITKSLDIIQEEINILQRNTNYVS